MNLVMGRCMVQPISWDSTFSLYEKIYVTWLQPPYWPFCTRIYFYADQHLVSWEQEELNFFQRCNFLFYSIWIRWESTIKTWSIVRSVVNRTRWWGLEQVLVGLVSTGLGNFAIPGGWGHFNVIRVLVSPEVRTQSGGGEKGTSIILFNGLQKPTAADLVILGDSYPKWNGSWIETRSLTKDSL